MKRYILSLVLLLLASFVFAGKLANLPEAMKPHFIQVNGDEFFITEQTDLSILVYSLETFKLKHKIGKRGEGPGEFKYMPFIREISPDYILCTSGEKALWFTREGKLIKENQLMIGKGLKLTPVKENYVALSIISDWKTGIVYKELHLLNSKYVKVKKLYRVLSDSTRFTPSDTGEEEFKMLPHYFNFLTHDDKIFIADTRKGFFIDAFDSNGNHLYSIDKKLEPVKVEETQKEKMLTHFKIAQKEIYERRKKSAFTFYKHYPPIRQIWTDDKKIYVTTYKEKDNKHELIILDLKGNILDKLLLPLKSTKVFRLMGGIDPHTIHKGVLYELIDNEKTEMWELHKTDLSTIK